MALDAVHPKYAEHLDDWITLRDLSKGEKAVKDKGVVYLPPTPGMVLDGMKSVDDVGWQVYQNYKARAVFPDLIDDAVKTYIGMLHFKPATIKVPAAMEPMLDSLTLEGESAQDLLRRINTEQLTTGRLGLLVDLPVAAPPGTTNAISNTQNPGPPTLPYIALYVAEAVRNWDEGELEEGFRELNLVILDESGSERGGEDNFEWVEVTKYRVLQLGALATNEKRGVYLNGVFSDKAGATPMFDATMMKEPVYKGKTLNEIPFVFVNSNDNLVEPDKSPLLGLARQALTIYQGEADYRQTLFMQGQDTLVVVGGARSDATGTGGTTGDADAIRTGAGSRIDVDVGGDAKYIGVSATGLPEQRTALENDRKRAETRAGQLMPGKSAVESGEALKTRLVAQTATLNSIALSGAKGLENSLKTIAIWTGQNPDDVEVTPNMEFGDLQLNAADLGALMAARLTGLPLSKESIHALLVQKRLTSMSFDDEMAKVDEEDAALRKVQVAQDKSLTQNKTILNKPPVRGAA